MPMAHTEQPIAIVHDGEAYNFGELRAELERVGEKFFSRTDTEVILRGYLLWGDSIVQRLRGMFAFAIWDGRGDGRLLLARDRFGQKPLYFHEEREDGLRFSSELKAMLNRNDPREIDPESLEYYLDHGCSPSDRCMLRGYRKVRPGHLLVWEGGHLRQRRYRSFAGADNSAKRMSEKETAEELRTKLGDAVKVQFLSDVPVGSLLSGDLHSAAMLACMSRLTLDPIRTYTACFGAAGLDESERARRTALSIGSRHRAIMINPRAGRLLPFIASHMDEPIADPSAIAIYLVCRLAREEVKVVLSGTGSKMDPRTCLAEAVLAKVDRMSMAASVETRAPFLDPVLAEWIMNLPTRSRTSCLRSNVILREGMRDCWSARGRKRSKQISAPPIDEWFRCEWRTLAQDVLLDAGTRQRGWWDETCVRRMLEEHLSGKHSHGERLYQLVILELWARSILDRGEAEPIPTGVDDCARELPTDKPVRKVAVIAPAGIGDTMRLTPSLVQLGASDPHVSVTVYVAADRGSDQVMAGMAPVDRHVQIDFDRKGMGKLVQLVCDIRGTSPDQVVSTWVSTLAGLAGFLTRVRQRSGWVPQWSAAMRLGRLFWPDWLPYDPPRKDVGRYDVSAFARLLGIEPLRRMAMKFAPPIWKEKALRDALTRIAGMSRPILAVSTAARERVRQRQYPIDETASVLTGLLRDGIVDSLVLLGDKASKPILEPLAEAVGSHGLDLGGELSISATAAVMRECDAALVVDGALLHVALASELPVVVLYGPTEIFSSDPRGEKGRYKVISAFDRCRCTCLPHRGIKARDECLERAQCLAAIPPARVVEAVAAMLTNGDVSLGARESEQPAEIR